jgi:hypothetical protein
VMGIIKFLPEDEVESLFPTSKKAVTSHDTSRTGGNAVLLCCSRDKLDAKGVVPRAL